MTRIDAYGKIENGALILHNRKRFEEDLRECRDCEVILVVKKRGRRSHQQNAYYWAVVVVEVRLRFRELGHRLDPDQVHDFLADKFAPQFLHDEDGTVIARIPGKTSEMSKGEFSEFIERVREWAAETLEIQIPDPNSDNSMKF